jgi:hypothetical protein
MCECTSVGCRRLESYSGHRPDARPPSGSLEGFVTALNRHGGNILNSLVFNLAAVDFSWSNDYDALPR